MLNRRVKSDIAYVDSRSDGDGKGLNAAIKILVIERVLVMPHSGRWIAHLVTHKPDAIVAWIRFELVHDSSCPSHYRRLLSVSRTQRTKTERRGAATHGVLMI